MRTYKVTVTQTTPSGEITQCTLDVLGANSDSALNRVYSWYNREHECLETGNTQNASLAFHPGPSND